MAEKDAMISVRAAKPAFRVLTHPAGFDLDDKGHGTWPADQFTFRRLEEKSLRRMDDPEDRAEISTAAAEGHKPVNNVVENPSTAKSK